jgi:hypothetical protein
MLNQTKYIVRVGKTLFDIPLNTEFDVLMPVNAPNDYVTSGAKLIEVVDSRNRKLDFLPALTYTCCLIEFSSGLPDLIFDLQLWHEKWQQKNQFLYLTTKPVANRMLELYNADDEVV